MFLEPNNLSFWQSSASIDVLKERAELLNLIRSFFVQRNVLEVDPPLLSYATVTAPFLTSFYFEAEKRFLQTSPEYAMKRLIANGSGDIFYCGKVFRQGEVGKRHNPEFTMLEWYRIHWNHLQLIEEINQLFQQIFGCESIETKTYHELFETYFNINPHRADVATLKAIALKKEWVQADMDCDRDGWLDLLITHGIEPHLGLSHPIAVTDYPASQGSLARLRQDEKAQAEVAERFEIYFQGMELANGYHELTNAAEQRKRFEEDNLKRQQLNLLQIPIDEYLLQALEHGMPNCAGVAIGFDRLLMLKLRQKDISKVIPFSWERA
jgi:lysyl-tRNA synthetase class 2